MNSGPVFDDTTGEWSCPLCYALVGRDNEEGEELFDDDEEAAFDNDEDYTAEGDRIQDQTEEVSEAGSSDTTDAEIDAEDLFCQPCGDVQLDMAPIAMAADSSNVQIDAINADMTEEETVLKRPAKRVRTDMLCPGLTYRGERLRGKRPLPPNYCSYRHEACCFSVMGKGSKG